MAIGTTTGILLALGGGAAAGFGASKLMSGGRNQIFLPTPLPQPPSADTAAEKAGEVIKKKRAAMTQSIYTSPLGVAGEAQIARKTLLGQ